MVDRSPEDAVNLRAFGDPAVVGVYARMLGLTEPETRLFSAYLSEGSDVLDLGIGGGRTTPALRSFGGRYVGIDYSAAMVEAARAKFPDADLRVGNAIDLSDFADESFDAVVFSFNGIDYLNPRGSRERCLIECARVLRPGGVLIYSSHNARFVLGRPNPRGRGLAWCRSAVGTSYRGIRLALRRISQGALWRREGYVRDPAHGGLVGYETTPRRERKQLEESGLVLEQVLPSTTPRRGLALTVPWYYYACTKGQRSA